MIKDDPLQGWYDLESSSGIKGSVYVTAMFQPSEMEIANSVSPASDKFDGLDSRRFRVSAALVELSRATGNMNVEIGDGSSIAVNTMSEDEAAAAIALHAKGMDENMFNSFVDSVLIDRGTTVLLKAAQPKTGNRMRMCGYVCVVTAFSCDCVSSALSSSADTYLAGKALLTNLKHQMSSVLNVRAGHLNDACEAVRCSSVKCSLLIRYD